MTLPKTLRDVSGLSPQPAALSGSALIMIDLQNTYREGVMKLEGVEAALVDDAGTDVASGTAVSPTIQPGASVEVDVPIAVEGEDVGDAVGALPAGVGVADAAHPERQTRSPVRVGEQRGGVVAGAEGEAPPGVGQELAAVVAADGVSGEVQRATLPH